MSDFFSNVAQSTLSAYIEKLGQTFGQNASYYESGRKSYPSAIFDLITTIIPKNASILELGCGTGIATKQLYEHGFSSIISSDIDSLMLEKAKIYCPNVSYQLVNGNNLPFENASFDSIMAFGCFHWFCTSQAIQEIKRVLKPQGVFFIINKQDTSSFRKDFRLFLQSLGCQTIIEPKTNYRPVDALAENHFLVEKHLFNSKEIFTKDQLTSYAQSISLWTNLCLETQQQYMPNLIQFIENIMQDHDSFERPIEIQCLIAYPKKRTEELSKQVNQKL